MGEIRQSLHNTSQCDRNNNFGKSAMFLLYFCLTTTIFIVISYQQDECAVNWQKHLFQLVAGTTGRDKET